MKPGIFEREYRELPIALIRPPSITARTRMSDEKMDELVAAIQTHGFQSVIGVFPVEDAYEVIFGHRRRIAAERAGLVAIPCFVYPSRDRGLEALKHMENAKREDMRPTEEAVYFDELLHSQCGGDTNALAALLSLKRDYVERRLLLFSGHREVFEALDNEDISIGIAEQLNKCTDPQHVRYMLHQAISCGWTVGVAVQAVHDWKHLHAHVQPGADAATVAAVPSPPIVDDYFTCRVCGLKENVGNMRPVQIHDYCIQAVFTPALNFFQQRRDYIEWPRSEAEAIRLIQQLTERFPSLAEETASA